MASHPLLFAPSLPLSRPKHGTRLALCRHPYPRSRQCMRAASDEAVPLNPHPDDPLTKEDAGEEQTLIGGKSIAPNDDKVKDVSVVNNVVKPSEYEEGPIEKQAGIGESAAVVEEGVGELVKEIEMGMKEQGKDVSKGKDVVEAVGEKDKVEDKGEKGESGGTRIQLTPEQIEKAKAARADAVKAEEEKAEKQKAQTRDILAKAEKLCVKVGTKTGAFKLGETARARAEQFVADSLALAEKKEPTQQEKLQASAAGAAKSVVAAVVKGWEEKVVPLVRDQLPEEYGVVTNKAWASVAVGLFVAVALLPSLLGGGKPQEAPMKKKIDAETAALEKKLARQRTSPYSSRSPSERGVFPPDDVSPPMGKVAESAKSPAPSSKVADATKSRTVPDASKPQAVAPPVTELMPPAPGVPAPQSIAPAVPPSAEVAPKPKPAPEPVKPVEVTPPMVLSAVNKALGSDARLVSSAAFDSLSAEPTVVLQVTKAFHTLPAVEQKVIADKALKASRGLGYERVSFVEVDTGMEVASAGINIVLEDEADNLRAELAAMKNQADKLSMQNTKDEAQIDALQNRLAQERDEFANERNTLNARLQNMEKDNSGLVQDLAEAKEEISRMPDRMALEERTIEAERKSDKLADTVEMLSKQLAKAREEEASAKRVEAESLAAVKQAENTKDEALASVDARIAKAQDEANRKATSDILAAENEAKAAIDVANKRVQDAEQNAATAEREAAKTVEEARASFEKQLAENTSARDKEIVTIQDKYEALLKEIQRKAQADLDAFQKEADKKFAQAERDTRSAINNLTKERDQAIKETEKVQMRGEKAAEKAAKEKEKLQGRITKLEAKLKGTDSSEPAADSSPAEGK